MAPKKIASARRAASSVASGSASPVAWKWSAPAAWASNRSSNGAPCASFSTSGIVASITSGPTPSPGSTAIE